MMPVETLVPNEFTRNIYNWIQIPSYPTETIWLQAADYPAKYIHNEGLPVNRMHKWRFTNSALTDKIIDQVLLRIRMRDQWVEDPVRYLSVYINGPLPPLISRDLLIPQSFAWVESDVTSIFTTWTKINNAELDLYTAGSQEQKTEYLNVIYPFVNVTKQWSTQGADPWIDAADHPTAYVLTSGDGNVMSRFDFETLAALGYVSTLELQIRCIGDGNDELIPSISADGGSSWNQLAAKVPGVGLYYLSWDVSSYLDTLAKINLASLKFEYNKVGSPGTTTVDHARLKIVHKNFCEVDAAQLQITWSEPVVARGYGDGFVKT